MFKKFNAKLRLLTGRNKSALDLYVKDYPEPQNAFDLFKNEWNCAIPGFDTGHVNTFDNANVLWFGQKLGGFAGKSIVELGPLEGAHTYMMVEAGASKVVAIEANSQAFLKCLVVQNALKFEADFRLGDFQRYLENTTDKADFILAHGVLYHMKEPVQVLEAMANIAPSWGLWTHYYSETFAKNRGSLKRRFSNIPRVQSFRGHNLKMYEQNYLTTVGRLGFSGGMEQKSHWMTRESLLKAIDLLGYDVTIKEDIPEGQHGPNITLYAARRPS